MNGKRRRKGSMARDEREWEVDRQEDVMKKR